MNQKSAIELAWSVSGLLVLFLCASGSTVAMAQAPSFDLDKCQLIELEGMTLDGIPIDTPLQCPFKPARTIKIHDFLTVVQCDQKTICGKEYGVLADYTGRFFYGESKEISVVEPPGETRDVPMLARHGGRMAFGDCIAARVVDERGGAFFRLDTADMIPHRITRLVRLVTGTQVFACYKFGDLLLAYHEGAVGLIQTAEVELEPIVIDAGYFETRGPFCREIVWQAVTTRPVFMYQRLPSGPQRFPEALRRGEPLSIIRMLTGRRVQGNPWLEVRANDRVGFVPMDAIAIEPDFGSKLPSVPMDTCPEVVATATVTCDVEAIPIAWLLPGRRGRMPNKVRLSKGASLPVLTVGLHSLKVLLFDAVVSLSNDRCVELDDSTVNDRILSPLQSVRPVKTAPEGERGALRKYLLRLIPETTIPGSRNPQVIRFSKMLSSGDNSKKILEQYGDSFPLESLTAPDLNELIESGAEKTLIRAVFRGANEAENLFDIFDEMEEDICPSKCRNPHGDESDSEYLENIVQSYKQHPELAITATLLIDGELHEVVARLPLCLKGECQSVDARLLFAMALSGLELPYLSRELFLDLLEAGDQLSEELLIVAFDELRGEVRITGTSPRVLDITRRLCTSGDQALPSKVKINSCLLAAQSALELNQDTTATTMLDLLGSTAEDIPRYFEARGRIALKRSVREEDEVDLKAGVDLYMRALRAALQKCSFHAELFQKMLLQVARAAYSSGDHSISYRLLKYMMPETLSEGFLLPLQLLSAPQDFERAKQLLACAGGRNRHLRESPEFALGSSFILTGRCKFGLAENAVTIASEKIAALKQLSAELDTVFRSSRINGALSWRAGELLEAIHATLLEHRLSSRHVEELQAIMRSTGACGRWGNLKNEISGLCRLATEVGAPRPNALKERLLALVKAADMPCVQGVVSATNQLRRRLNDLEVATVFIRDDIRLALETNWDETIRFWGSVAGSAKSNYCDDLKAWANGEDPSWIDSIDGLLFRFDPLCRHRSDIKLSESQKEAFDEATDSGRNLCSVQSNKSEDSQVNTADLWLATEQFLDERATTALGCLIEAEEEGARKSGLLLLIRGYLPGLMLIRHSHLDALGMLSVSGRIMSVLRTMADNSSTLRDSLCSPGR